MAELPDLSTDSHKGDIEKAVKMLEGIVRLRYCYGPHAQETSAYPWSASRSPGWKCSRSTTSA